MFEIKCKKSLLTENINVVARAVSTRSTLPITGCILLIADKAGFRLLANDMEISIESENIESEVYELGTVALEAKIFDNTVKSFTGDVISIKADDKNNVEITDGSAKFKIKGQPGIEFPMPPVLDAEDNCLEVPSHVFKNMIKKTIFSVAVDDSRPVLTGELIKIESNVLNVVAIDGFRVSWQREPIDYNDNLSMVVPAKALTEVSRLLPDDEESKTNIYFTEKHAMFMFKGCKIVSRLLEGEFLNYENLFNCDNKTELIVNKYSLTSALSRTTIISNDTKNPRVNMKIGNNVLVIDANDDRGNVHEEIVAETNGDELNISFNSRYLLDILGAVDEDLVSFNFMTEKSPCIVKSVTGKEYKYLVLPLLQF